MAGNHFGAPLTDSSGLLRRGEMGRQYGSVHIVSSEVNWNRTPSGSKILFVQVQCASCGRRSWINYWNIVRGRSAGCRDCNQPLRAPKWLVLRLAQAKDRCTNPNNDRFTDYGGRGIEFRFPTVIDAAIWVKENLGINRDLEIDRIDNDRHYEAGNLRLSTRKQNQAHTRRRPIVPMMHAFRLKYPEIRYADATLRTLIGRGMTEEEILERWAKPSSKPKGVYGTYLTPDPFIVSRSPDGWSTTA